jgi:G3E family GTPase
VKKIPVHIITGFLGAGKTTAILHLLQQKPADEQWAVVVNEFGKISFDGRTLSASSDKTEVYEISGGCICCTAFAYLNDTIDQILQTSGFSRILIEPSGLGGIERVSEIVASKPQLELKPVICLVDILTAGTQKVLRIPVYKQQIIKSDIIVFTKTDLVSDLHELEQLVKGFRAHFTNIWIYTKNSISIDTLNIFPEEKPELSAMLTYEFSFSSISAEHYFKKSCIFDSELIFDIRKLKKALEQHPEILRAKGYFRDKVGWKMLNYTLTHCNIENCSPGIQSEIVIIAEKTGIADYEELLKSALYESELA